MRRWHAGQGALYRSRARGAASWQGTKERVETSILAGLLKNAAVAYAPRLVCLPVSLAADVDVVAEVALSTDRPVVQRELPGADGRLIIIFPRDFAYGQLIPGQDTRIVALHHYNARRSLRLTLCVSSHGTLHGHCYSQTLGTPHTL